MNGKFYTHNPIVSKGAEHWRVFTKTLEEEQLDLCLDFYLQAAYSGDPQAMWLVGEIFYGIDVEILLRPQHIYYNDFKPTNRWADWQRAAFWLGEGTLLGSMEATFRYAQLLFYGRGIQRNYDTALQLFKLVDDYQIKHGSISYYCDPAWYIQDLLLDCPGVHRNTDLAIVYIERWKEALDRYSSVTLALMHLGGQLEEYGGPPQDTQKAIELLSRDWFENQTPYCAYLLGRIYAYGIGEKIDTKRAEHWLKLAACGGDERAQQLLNNLNINTDFQ